MLIRCCVTFDGNGACQSTHSHTLPLSRCLQQRVDSLTLLVGKDEDGLKEVFQHKLSLMHAGWVTLLVPSAEQVHTHITCTHTHITMYVYVLRTDSKPEARFKAVQTVSKRSSPFYSRPDSF